jgi:hypothetical protein
VGFLPPGGGHGNKARQAMEAHVQRVTEFCAQQLPRQMDTYIDWR